MTALRDPYWSDGQATIYHGDARQVLAEMPAGSVDCIVTSPPYWGLRHYCDGQYGQEPTIQAYVETLRSTFAEARRVLTDDGTCCSTSATSTPPTPTAVPAGRPSTGASPSCGPEPASRFLRRTCSACLGGSLSPSRRTAGSCATPSSGTNPTRCRSPSETASPTGTS